MADTFSSYSTGLDSPATFHFLITPSDTIPLAIMPRGIKCLTAGTIMIKDPLGTAIPYNMAAGDTEPFRPYIVMLTGTTGTYAGWY